MSDVNFMNAYNDVVLENFMAVLKQNFMFQTQIRFLEERVSTIPALEEKGNLYDSVVQDKQRLEEKIVSMKSEIESKDTVIKNSSNSDSERHRLQTALNQQAQQIELLNGRISKFEDEQEEQKEYIRQLEEMLPNSKKKKLGIPVEEIVTPLVKEEEVKKEETPKIDNVKLKVQSSGGTF